MPRDPQSSELDAVLTLLRQADGCTSLAAGCAQCADAVHEALLKLEVLVKDGRTSGVIG